MNPQPDDDIAVMGKLRQELLCRAKHQYCARSFFAENFGDTGIKEHPSRKVVLRPDDPSWAVRKLHGDSSISMAFTSVLNKNCVDFLLPKMDSSPDWLTQLTPRGLLDVTFRLRAVNSLFFAQAAGNKERDRAGFVHSDTVRLFLGYLWAASVRGQLCGANDCETAHRYPAVIVPASRSTDVEARIWNVPSGVTTGIREDAKTPLFLSSHLCALDYRYHLMWERHPLTIDAFDDDFGSGEKTRGSATLLLWCHNLECAQRFHAALDKVVEGVKEIVLPFVQKFIKDGVQFSHDEAQKIADATREHTITPARIEAACGADVAMRTVMFSFFEAAVFSHIVTKVKYGIKLEIYTREQAGLFRAFCTPPIMHIEAFSILRAASMNRNLNPSPLCEFCSAFSATKCSACKKAFYCSPECQKNDWKAHKETCQRR